VDEVIRVTPAALVLVREALAKEPEPGNLALWLEVNGIAKGFYTYDLWFGARAAICAGDACQHEEGVLVVVPAESIGRLKGAVLDASEQNGEPGLMIVNTNTPSRPALPGGARGELTGPVAQAVLDVLENDVNPFIAGHGGRAALVAVDGAVAYVEMSGGCQGCGLAGATLSQGIAVAITDAVPEIREVFDVTDHSVGTSPYFAPGRV
jgi:Fe/S biogenesis protein NfuA